MPGRKLDGEADARACLAAAARSGLPRAQWARQNGVDGRSLNGWRMALERRQQKLASEPSPLRLVEVIASKPAPPTSSRTSGVRVRLGDLVIELDRTPNFRRVPRAPTRVRRGSKAGPRSFSP